MPKKPFHGGNTGSNPVGDAKPEKIVRIIPARIHTPFVDGYLRENYPGREQEAFDHSSRTQPVGRIAQPEEVAALALFLCSDQANFITGVDYPIDGGFLNLR